MTPFLGTGCEKYLRMNSGLEDVQELPIGVVKPVLGFEV
jgi:hypothetical protein